MITKYSWKKYVMRVFKDLTHNLKLPINKVIWIKFKFSVVIIFAIFRIILFFAKIFAENLEEVGCWWEKISKSWSVLHELEHSKSVITTWGQYYIQSYFSCVRMYCLLCSYSVFCTVFLFCVFCTVFLHWICSVCCLLAISFIIHKPWHILLN